MSPPDVASYQVVIVPIIFKKGKEEVLEFCRKMEDSLRDKGNLRVYLDDRDIRAGKKFYEWEMRGVPLRIEIGARDIQNGEMVVLSRNNLQKETMKYDPQTFTGKIDEILKNISQNMAHKSWESFNKNIRPVSNTDEALEEISKHGGIISFNWCGDKSCGKDLEEKLRVDILGVQEISKKKRHVLTAETPLKK